MRPNTTDGYPGRSYRFYTGGDEVFKFGAGMSFTSFEARVALQDAWHGGLPSVSLADVQRGLDADADAVVARVRVAVINVGARAGAHTALVFVAPPAGVAGVDGAPLKLLAGFEKKHVDVGGEATIELAVRARDLALADPVTGAFAPRAGVWRVWVNNDGERDALTLTVSSDAALA